MTTKIPQTIASDIKTNTAGYDPVAAKADSTAALAGLAVEGAFAVDKHIRLQDLADEQQGVKDQFNIDLEEGVQADAIKEFAKENPQVKNLENTLNKLALGDKQGVAQNMIKFRAEAATNRAIAAAPGLREELRGIAAATLGFDPTGATMKKLLSTDNNTSRDPNAGLLGKIQSKAIELGISTMDTDGVPLTLQPLEAKVFEHQQYTNKKEAFQELTGDNIVKAADSINKHYRSKFSDVQSSYNNLADFVKTEEDFLKFKQDNAQEMLTYANALELAIDNDYALFNRGGLTGDQLDRLQNLQKESKSYIKSLRDMAEAKNFTDFETRADLLESLRKAGQLEFSQLHANADYLMTNFSGLIQGAASDIWATSPALRTKISGTLAASLDPETTKQVSFENYLGVIQGAISFEDLSTDEKTEVASKAWTTLKYATKHPEKAMASDGALEETARAYAVVLNSFNPMNPDEVREAQKLLVDDAFIGIQDAVAKLPNGEVKSEMIADSATIMMVQYMTGAGIDDAILQAKRVGATISFDLDKGKFFMSKFGDSEVRGITATKAFKQKALQALENLNNTTSAFNDYRNHDEFLETLSKEQALQEAVYGPLKGKGINIHGTVREIPESPARKREKEGIKFAEMSDKLKATITERKEALIKQGMSKKDADEVFKDIDKIVDEPVSLPQISPEENLEIDIEVATMDYPEIAEVVERRRDKGVSDKVIWEAIQRYMKGKKVPGGVNDQLADVGINLDK